ncbi:MAG: ATP-binding protein, partial [Alphaproteobacteria bacterium]
VGLIGWQIRKVWLARRRGSAGARLHVRLVTLFAMVAVVPAVLVAVFASVTLDRGLDTWFSQRTRAIIDNAQSVAEAYLQEHSQIIRADASAMGQDVDRARNLFVTDVNRFVRFLTTQTAIRALAATFIVHGDGKLVAHVRRRREIVYIKPPAAALAAATEKKGQVVIFQPNQANMIRALVSLPNFDDSFLYLYRQVDAKVIAHLRSTRENRAEYNALEARRSGVQITFGLMYVGMALIFLLAAIWFGLWVADRLVAPIGRLINAARRVSDGDLDVAVDIPTSQGDLAALGRTFNDMTRQLGHQRAELVQANETMDSRRRFIEAVLSGVTSGVIGLDAKGKVALANRSALTLLETQLDEIVGKNLSKLVPEFKTLLAKASKRSARLVDGQVSIGKAGNQKILLLRVTTEGSKGKGRRFVVTFDDITNLVSAQRSAAWGDIAQRIAHEIKNPLTPIQLSAERLKRKYIGQISQDQEIFLQCTDTIIRQVGDIGRMVDEFSSFARMPKAAIEMHDLNKVVRESAVLQRVAFPEITFTIDVPDGPQLTAFDYRLIGQALTNLIKNASEAIEGKAVTMNNGSKIDANLASGKIAIKLRYGADKTAIIEVIDNGIGLPKNDRHRLVEPYMTTREKGTGLGLAIVRKIIEEHDGTLELLDAPDVAAGKAGATGALVRLKMPLKKTKTDKIIDLTPAKSNSDHASIQDGV